MLHITDECNTNNGGCSHTCTDTNESYKCSCRTGYILADDDHGCNGMLYNIYCSQIQGCDHITVKYLSLSLTFLIDINECVNDTSGCEQLCHNTIGSYYCTCEEGYYLGNDNHSCLGM